jgi:antitoxin (DNA-binding transcriptional repressor) of toxin-antitoxin stability system
MIMGKEIEVTTHEFKTHISSLIRRMQCGEMDRVIVKNRNEPVGVFQLYGTQRPKRKLGGMEGLINFDMEEWKKADKEIEEEIYKNIEEEWIREHMGADGEHSS